MISPDQADHHRISSASADAPVFLTIRRRSRPIMMAGMNALARVSSEQLKEQKSFPRLERPVGFLDIPTGILFRAARALASRYRVIFVSNKSMRGAVGMPRAKGSLPND
ncbi:hypothetical protein [Mesorhizobium sp.]|uniref:hypothetical protein n=1 Tax=Mesorhizobium sp. TaxID=1871066 RepID=UPI003BA9A638